MAENAVLGINGDKPINVENGMQTAGRALVSSVTTAMTSTNKKYADGVLTTKAGSVKFKKWDYTDKDNIRSGVVYNLRGTWNQWNGTWQLIINSYSEAKGEDPDDYMGYSAYDVNSIHADIKKMMKDRVTDKGIKLMNLIICGNKTDECPNLTKRFMSEFAAISHHDAVPGGLIAHSFKTFSYICTVIDLADKGLYKLPTSKDFRDILIVGALVHDIGKAIEYDHGGISEKGKYISHRTIACERLFMLKDRIVSMYGIDGYYKLTSIFAQHHGQYEETPRTKEAVIIHAADQMDSIVSDVTGAWARANNDGENGEDGESFKYEDKKLI